MAKTYWFYKNELNVIDGKITREGFERQDNGIEVLKLSDVKKNFLEKSFIKNQIDKIFKKYDNKIWHFNKNGNDTLHKLEKELKKRLGL